MARQANALYTLPPDELDSHLRAAARHGEQISQWSLATCADKPALLDQMAHDLGVTASFGHNWDALADSLCDLAWSQLEPGLVLAFTHTASWRQHNPEALAILTAILQEACAFWQRRHQSFRVFMATV